MEKWQKIQMGYKKKIQMAKNTNGKIKVRVIHDTFKLKSFFRVKEGQALLHRSNVVHHIHCSCGSNYTGETARNLLTRLNEHNPGSKKCKNTDVTNHLYENSDHKIDFAKPNILGTARNQTQLFILETLSIDKLKPDINVDQSSITLYLFNTWLFFVFILFSHSLHCASITELLSVLSSGTSDCLHQQVLLNFSAMYNLYWNVSTLIRD